jgi:phage tail sheath protein FI
LSDLTQFALFENNDSKLWARIRSSVGVFLTGYLNQGGLRGDTPAQAFYVKCDAENNPQADVLNSQVNIEIGVALQYPAEFVVITLSQNTSA